MHPGGGVARHMRTQMHAELGTQAWCKFHEVLGTFPKLTDIKSNNSLQTVHLCEAPGAFIASLNHFLSTRGMYVPVVPKYNVKVGCADVSCLLFYLQSLT